MLRHNVQLADAAKDGPYFWALMEAIAAQDTDGAPMCYAVACLDMSFLPPYSLPRRDHSHE